MKPFFLIYKITNILNGKTYIGKHKTFNINDDYLGSGILIKRAVKKHGKESFTKEILFIFDNVEEMDQKEKELVTEEYTSFRDNYNLAPGGPGGGFEFANLHGLNNYPNKGAIGTKTLMKVKENWKPEWSQNGIKAMNSITRERIKNGTWVNPFQGKTHKNETKTIIGEKNKIAQSGSKNSQFGTMWITNGTENKKVKKLDDIPEGWYKGRVNKK